jgi:outer membrane protein
MGWGILRYLSVVCWLVVGLAIYGGSEGARAESLMEALQQAQNSDPDYQAAKYQNRADAEATKQAWARFLPHLRAEANYESLGQNILSSDNTVYAVGRTSYPDYGYAVVLDQSLFNYADWANLRAARALTRQSDAQFEAAKQDLLMRVAERYFTVLVAAETADAARSEVRALKEHLDLVQSKLAGGAVRKAEELDARARYLQGQARQARADAAVRDAVAGLRTVTGQTYVDFRGLSDRFTVKPLDPADVESWLDMARRNNPRIKAAAEASERGHQQVETERARWYPNVALQLYQNRRRTEGSLFGGGSDIEDMGGMVKLNVPIYEGGATSSRIREAGALYGKARANQDKTGRDVDHETEAAVDGIKTAQTQVEALRASLQAQEQVVAQLTDAFHSGVAASVDVLDAERDLFLARAQYVRARYDYALNTLKLRHAVGLLDIADLEEVDRLLAGKPVSVAGYGVAVLQPIKLPVSVYDDDPAPAPKAEAAPKKEAAPKADENENAQAALSAPQMATVTPEWQAANGAVRIADDDAPVVLRPPASASPAPGASDADIPGD